MQICVPSYGRAGRVTTLNFFPDAKLFVNEIEADEYSKFYPDNLIVVPKERDGSASIKRNAILDYSTDNQIIVIDDDFVGLSGKEFVVDTILGRFATLFSMCADINSPLFGFNPSGDPLRNPSYQPLSFIKPVYGCVGIDKERLTHRYDERLYAHEDLDFCLMTLYQKQLIVRDNRYHFCFGSNKGGGVDYTSPKRVSSTLLMKQKWGNSFLKFDSLTITGVRSPLLGV